MGLLWLKVLRKNNSEQAWTNPKGGGHTNQILPSLENCWSAPVNIGWGLVPSPLVN